MHQKCWKLTKLKYGVITASLISLSVQDKYFLEKVRVIWAKSLLKLMITLTQMFREKQRNEPRLTAKVNSGIYVRNQNGSPAGNQFNIYFAKVSEQCLRIFHKGPWTLQNIIVLSHRWCIL